jgi:hypothetical protein
MAVIVKKQTVSNNTIKLQIGGDIAMLQTIPAEEVAKANARIQRRIQPIFHKIKITRRAAAIRASKIILNA